MAIESPIFLVGAERSGTTLLRLMLDHHPRVAFQMEFEYVVDRIENGQFPDVAEYADWLRHNFVFQAVDFKIDESLNYSDLVNSFLEQKRGEKAIVGATIHRHFRRVLEVWPEARFIYLQRDGRDVARSAMNMGWAGNVYHAADGWLEAVHEWEATVEVVPEERRLETRYETLVSDPKGEGTRICEWIGVEYDEAMYDYTKESHYRAPDAKLAYQWKHKLSVRDLQLIEARIAEKLVERGYELSGHPPITVSVMKDRQLDFESRFKRYQKRLQRYGLANTLGETLTRRLGMESSNRSYLQKLYAIDHDRFKPADKRK